MNAINTINNSGKNITFSGTDTIAFIILPNTAPICLGSLTTLSYSSYRVKTPINTLGGIKVKGVAKGIRTVAGTMVCTLINQHWVNELIDNVPWLNKKAEGTIYSDELPLFDIMLVSANEYGKYVSMHLYGVDLTDEAGVLSVNDMYSENTFSFIAREIKTFSDRKIKGKDLMYNSNQSFNMLKGFTFAIYNTNEYKPTYEFKPYIDTPTVYDKYPKDCRVKLLDLGYTKYSNQNAIKEISKAINEILKDTGFEENDKDYFIENILPFLTKDYITNNIYISKRKSNTFTNKNMKIANSSFEKNERVYILDKDVDEFNKPIYFTNKGYIKSDEIKSKEKNITSNIKDIVLNKTSLMPEIKNNDIINTNESIDTFLKNFKVLISSKEHEEYITNVCIKDENGSFKNNLKTFVSNGDSKINFEDRLNFIKKYADGKSIITFIVFNKDKKENYVIPIKFNKYKNGGVF